MDLLTKLKLHLQGYIHFLKALGKRLFSCALTLPKAVGIPSPDSLTSLRSALLHFSLISLLSLCLHQKRAVNGSPLLKNHLITWDFWKLQDN